VAAADLAVLPRDDNVRVDVREQCVEVAARSRVEHGGA
jgi:hypothetical protein